MHLCPYRSRWFRIMLLFGSPPCWHPSAFENLDWRLNRSKEEEIWTTYFLITADTIIIIITMVYQRRASSVVPIQEGCCNGSSQTNYSVSVRFGAEGVISSTSKSNWKQFKPLGKLMNALVKLFTPWGEDAVTREYLQAMAKVDFLGYNGASDESCYPRRQCKFRDCDRETHAMLVDLERSRLAEFAVFGIHGWVSEHH